MIIKREVATKGGTIALKQLQQYLSALFYERDEEVRGLPLAALAREFVDVIWL